MGSRGRKTKADREMAAAVDKETGQELPPPPSHLPDEAKDEWTDIVSTYPPDRFPRSTWPMLESYCRHAVNARKIGKMLDSVGGDVTVKELNQLYTMFNRETKTLASFGVRLGVARTSMAGRHNHDPEETRDGSPAPWED